MEATHEPVRFGATTFEEEQPVAASKLLRDNDLGLTEAQGRWMPPAHVAPFLPEDFSISIIRYTDSTGFRRYVFADSLEVLIDRAATAGLAVLQGISGHEPAVDHTYRAMMLLNQYVRGRSYRGGRGMREHRNRQFSSSRDIFLRRPSRLEPDKRNLLPARTGSRAVGSERDWSPTYLAERGREAARDAGHANPINRIAIPYGLYELAQSEPLALDARDVAKLVRMALFESPSSSGPPSEELCEIVFERFVKLVQGKGDRDWRHFEKSVFGSNNSIVKQIARPKHQRGGSLDIDQVRLALLHLGWQSYQYVAQCIHAVMRYIKNSIAPALTIAERQQFEAMYECQPAFGNLPLALLAERLDFLRPAIVAVWERPGDTPAVAALHRMLAYYAEMATTRRQADLLAKQSSPTRRHNQRVIGQEISLESLSEFDLPPICEGIEDGDADGMEDATPRTVQRDGFDAFAAQPRLEVPEAFFAAGEYLREQRGMVCSAGCATWDYRLEEEAADPLRIRICCACGQTSAVMEVSLAEFAQIVREQAE